MHKNIVGSVYIEQSEEFTKGLLPNISRCIKANKHDVCAVEVIKFERMVDMYDGEITIFGQDKTRQDKTRQDKTRQDKTRQDNIIVLGQLEGDYDSVNRIYSTDGISPTLPTFCGGNQERKMLEVKKLEAQSLRMVRTEEGKALRKAYENGKIHHGFNEHRTAEPKKDGISNTVTTVQKDNLILVICNEINEMYHNFIYEIDGDFYLIRIRKLTPKECWRLMGFTDEDFEKAASVVSNTQLYKQAGNSIVKDVLMDIFRQLLM